MHEKLVNRLNEYIQLERDLRAASSDDSLGFVVTNYLKKLLDYDSAIWLLKGDRSANFNVCSVSGVSDFDVNAPLIQFCGEFCNSSLMTFKDTEVHRLDSLPVSFADSLKAIGLTQVVSVCVIQGEAILMLVREKPWQLYELQILQQISEVVAHARRSLAAPRKSNARSGFGKWLRPTWRWGVCALLILAALPVRQSIVASGEITAMSPAVVASGLDAVIAEVLVKPNQSVTQGELLVRFDSSDLTLQQGSLEKELQLAVEKLRKAEQQSLSSTEQVTNIADLRAQTDLRRLELDYLQEKIQRLQLHAPADGIVLFSRKKDWEGRAVRTGEKIMELASDADRKFEIWVDAQDAIELEQGSNVQFYPDAHPLQSVTGSVEQVSYFSANTGNAELGFRVVANSHDEVQDLRLGTKGTFRLYGGRVLLGYHLLRKPLSVLRRNVGV